MCLWATTNKNTNIILSWHNIVSDIQRWMPHWRMPHVCVCWCVRLSECQVQNPICIVCWDMELFFITALFIIFNLDTTLTHTVQHVIGLLIAQHMPPTSLIEVDQLVVQGDRLFNFNHSMQNLWDKTVSLTHVIQFHATPLRQNCLFYSYNTASCNITETNLSLLLM